MHEVPEPENWVVKSLKKGARDALLAVTVAGAAVGGVQGYRHVQSQSAARFQAFKEGGFSLRPEDIGNTSLLAFCLEESKKPDAPLSCFNAVCGLATMEEADGKDALLQISETAKERFKNDPVKLSEINNSIGQRLARPKDDLKGTKSEHRTQRNNPDVAAAFRVMMASALICKERMETPDLEPKHYDDCAGSIIRLLGPVPYWKLHANDRDELFDFLRSTEVRGTWNIEYELYRQSILHADTITSDDIAAIRSGSVSKHQASRLTE